MSAAGSGAGVGLTGDGLGVIEATGLGVGEGVEATVGAARRGGGVELCATPHAANSVTARITRSALRSMCLRITTPPVLLRWSYVNCRRC